MATTRPRPVCVMPTTAGTLVASVRYVPPENWLIEPVPPLL